MKFLINTQAFTFKPEKEENDSLQNSGEGASVEAAETPRNGTRDNARDNAPNDARDDVQDGARDDAPENLRETSKETPGVKTSPKPQTENAYFALGCFWGAQKIFTNTRGVIATTVGYMGGHTPSPTYESVCTDTTGHAETVYVKFDPSIVSYRELLELFFRHHDSTTRNRQGEDVGSQYRSALFTTSAQQAATAKTVMLELTPAIISRYGAAPVTEIVPPTEAITFWRAEEYHQQYIQKNPDGYCSIRDNGIVCN